jgi:glycosyltransferase involved in cell wall biosynthesis
MQSELINRKKETIFYDANFAIGNFKGMGKYLNNFINVLENQVNVNCIGLLKNKSNHNSKKYIIFGFNIYFLWEQISLYFFQKNNKSFFIYPYNTAPVFIKHQNNHVLFVHDLIFMNPYQSKSLKQIFGNLYRRIVLPIIIKKFNNIITVSIYSKELIVSKFNIDRSIVHVIYNSIDITNYNFYENISFNDRRNIIFHIGGEPNYKNTETVLNAFYNFHRKSNISFILKIVGIRNNNSIKYFLNKCKELDIDKYVEFLPYQTDDEIKNLYCTSKFFILPSKEEGFGIPIIESLKYGCPLICSNASCLPEIAGDCALYFNPNSILELCSKMNELLINISETESRILLGYKQVSKFSSENFCKNVTNWFYNK